MPIEVPYQYKQDAFGGRVCNPVLVIEVAIQSGYQAFEFLLDSGADCAVVPKHMANLTGVKLARKAEVWLGGIGNNSMAAYRRYSATPVILANNAHKKHAAAVAEGQATVKFKALYS